MRRWWIGGIQGIDHVPARGPCLVISNHSSYLDFLILSAVFELDLGRILRFWVSDRITRHWFFRHYCELAGCLEVGRQSMKAAWQESVRCLTQRDDFLCIFPEGTRTRTGRLQNFKLGYLRLASESGVPVVPVRLDNPYEAWPPHRRFPRVRSVQIEFYPSLRVDRDLALSQLQELNASIRSRCYHQS